jgi:ABC-type antimicrobial peptide transport system permease subunit
MLFHRHQFQQDLDDEMRLHVELRREQQMAAGADPESARKVALRRFGIGIYGVMSYLVGRRTGEIGIRMALGASRGAVAWQVMREIVILLALGIAIGLPTALAGGRLVDSMLYGIGGRDPVSEAVSVAVLIAAALLAGYLPARRAARIDPLVALRYE